ncbi:MAG: hypothetical protein EPO23_00375 [Xanthobacteraceae bacterium]|nr:MAG: hypothetical protein EPO23_00375 [Xanthobacteraceae bacterium]
MARASVVAAFALGATMLGGCAGGDFGRTRASFLSDDMHGWVGREAVARVGEPASRFRLTEQERALRDLAYPFIEPPRARPAWAGVFGDYVPIPAPWEQTVAFDATAYGRRLIEEPHRSHASRYGVLIEDVRNDITRIESFFTVALRVLDLDAKRNASLPYISGLSEGEAANARARMRENALVVQWVQQCIHQRIASYRWAMERLVLTAPDPMAVEAERVLALLSARAAGAPLQATPMAGQPVAVRG